LHIYYPYCKYVFSRTVCKVAYSRRHLRSADTMKQSAQRTRTVLGARAFAVSAAVIRDILPTEFRLTSFIQTFSRRPKTLYVSSIV